MDSVGDRLRQARVARGLTQAQLARGVATKGLISQIECNRTSPSLPRLRLLADRLGLPVSYFLEEAPADEQSYLPKAADLAIRAGEPERAIALVDEAERLSGAEMGAIRLAEGKYDEALSYLQQDDRNPISVKLMVTANQKMGHKDVAMQLSEVLANWNEPTLEQSLVVPEFRPKDTAASSSSSFRRM